MQLYCVEGAANDNEVLWCATRAEAQAAGKRVTPVYRPSVRIRLLNIGTDKEDVLHMLNAGVPGKAEQLRAWKLTARGGLADLSEP
jgi:hypothetical protein